MTVLPQASEAVQESAGLRAAPQPGFPHQHDWVVREVLHGESGLATSLFVCNSCGTSDI